MDSLTGAWARGQLIVKLEADFANQRSVVLLVADVDRCSHMTGSLGYVKVDQYLRDVVELLAESLGEE